MSVRDSRSAAEPRVRGPGPPEAFMSSFLLALVLGPALGPALAAEPLAVEPPAEAPVPPAVHLQTGAAPVVYEYRGPSVQGRYPADEVLALVNLAPTGAHEVRGGTARDWTAWNHVPALALGLLHPQPSAVYLWWGGEGDPVALSAAGVASRMRASPTGTHRVWKPGLAEWTDPRTLPSLQREFAAIPASADTDAPPTSPPVNGTSPAPRASAPESTPEHAPEPVPKTGAGCATGLKASFGADVRIDFAANDLGQLGEPAGVPAGFVVSRVRPRLDVALGPSLSGRASFELAQDDATTAYSSTGITLNVADWAGGWSLRGREIYLEARAGTAIRHRVRVGAQEPAFGVRDSYEQDYPFAGAEQRTDLARREGLLPDDDIGIGWHAAIGDRWETDLQFLNGTGAGSLDANLGKDLVARVVATPIDTVRVGLSGLYGARGALSDGQQLQGELSVEIAGTHQRILLEGVAGATTEDRLGTVFTAAGATGRWDIPLKNGWLNQLLLVGRAYYHDPVLGFDQPDGWWAPGVGLWLEWDVFPAHAAPGAAVRTGATWEMSVPQDLAARVKHNLVAEAAWSF